MKRRYLFTLEIVPLDIGVVYDELPSHLTLMSRFFSELSPDQLTESVQPLFTSTRPLQLLFSDTAKLGPKKLVVHTVEHSAELTELHERLRELLDSLKAEFEYPQFIGKHHKPHVTRREGLQFDTGSVRHVKAGYLIEIVDRKRVVRSKLDLLDGNIKQFSHNPVLVFISGSINSGKTTTSKLLANRIGAAFINVDDLNDTIPDFNLATDLDASMSLAISKINEHLSAGKDVVANYVVRPSDYVRFAEEIKTPKQYVITLAPRLEVAQSKRGERVLSDWEVARIKYHYDSGVASPTFGHIVDNSDLGPEETVDYILKIINS